jgi:hypothetical protein
MATKVGIFNRGRRAVVVSSLSFSTAGANMNLKLAVFGLAIASVVLGDQAQAQTYRNQLRGINQIGFLIENLDEDQKECQLTEALIRDAFMYPASGARFVVNKTSNPPHMYFGITTLFF